MINMTEEQYNKFLDLAGRLSSENLSCDGMLTRSQVNFKRVRIEKEWRRLEDELHRTISQDEIWNEAINRQVNA